MTKMRKYLILVGFWCKITDVEDKIPTIIGLATTNAPNADTKCWGSRQENKLQCKKHEALRLNSLLLLITINLWVKYLMQK